MPTPEKLAVMKAWLEEHKAQQVESIDLTGKGAFTDALLVASATSVRHAQSLADGQPLPVEQYVDLETRGLETVLIQEEGEVRFFDIA